MISANRSYASREPDQWKLHFNVQLVGERAASRCRLDGVGGETGVQLTLGCVVHLVDMRPAAHHTRRHLRHRSHRHRCQKGAQSQPLVSVMIFSILSISSYFGGQNQRHTSPRVLQFVCFLFVC
jgi:hypothetical protein